MEEPPKNYFPDLLLFLVHFNKNTNFMKIICYFHFDLQYVRPIDRQIDIICVPMHNHNNEFIVASLS